LKKKKQGKSLRELTGRRGIRVPMRIERIEAQRELKIGGWGFVGCRKVESKKIATKLAVKGRSK